MARSKVRPESRRRIEQACEVCKKSKRRCDGRRPYCSRCIRQHKTKNCDYRDQLLPHGGPSSAPGTSSIRKAADVSPDDDSLSTTAPSTRTTRPSHAQASLLSPSNQLPSIATPLSQPEHLHNSPESNKFYIGPSGPLSFLRLLREALARRDGNFEPDVGGFDVLFEAEEPHGFGDEWKDLLLFDKLTKFTDLFFIATTGVLHVISRDDLIEKISQLCDQQGNDLSLISPMVALPIAIGAQSQVQDETNQRYAKAFSRAAYRAIRSECLLMPTLKTTQMSVLMAFYLLTAYRRNAAYMYLGIAARGAHTLGLHHVSFYNSEQATTAMSSLSLWKSICVLDVMVSSLLGRPPAVALFRQLPREIVVRSVPCFDMGYLALEASFRLAKILREILDRIYIQRETSFAFAERVLQELTDWRLSLPPQLRVPIPQAGAVQGEIPDQDRQSVTASLRVALLYYHAVMLTTRPFLVAKVGMALRESSKKSLSDSRLTEPHPGDESTSQNHLYTACVDSATYMSETIHNAAKTNILLPNTCFIKVWAFEAALTLGFSLFIEPERAFETMPTFELGIGFLRGESACSPYAKQYYEILKDVTKAIRYRHHCCAQQRRRATTSYVDRVVDCSPGTEELFDSWQELRNDAPVNQDMSEICENLEDLMGDWNEESMALFAPNAETPSGIGTSQHEKSDKHQSDSSQTSAQDPTTDNESSVVAESSTPFCQNSAAHGTKPVQEVSNTEVPLKRKRVVLPTTVTDLLPTVSDYNQELIVPPSTIHHLYATMTQIKDSEVIAHRVHELLHYFGRHFLIGLIRQRARAFVAANGPSVPQESEQANEMVRLMRIYNYNESPITKLLAFQAALAISRKIGEMIENYEAEPGAAGNPNHKAVGDCCRRFAILESQELNVLASNQINTAPDEAKWKSVYELGKRLEMFVDIFAVNGNGKSYFPSLQSWIY
ncbi:hypothetical protein PFICI_07582 [Pestalotiopsis fici W106-1]|uniref:Zn(2)-C6 fungal-type domain-containing protein n=1 Tax=Pestalotiopsis fici (strain W106-1 / CGMCC3.15140) TaxID=1229662 RepID=W3X1P0_PESFW|nr:uncharacterized protein PFICI_07582 [Pestalotiopsis fici W106-1]ETS80053.1 hypothetical protein PFICI_07582 [Pestalotiopsis fici W106-1]